MDLSQLIECLNPTELIAEAPPLILWEMGVAGDVDSVAKFLYRGGPLPPQASIKRPRHFKLSEDDPRPDKRYWDCVKEELTVFLCTSDKRYKELWKKLGALGDGSTYTIVALISAYLGDQLGVQAAAISAFVAVFLFGFAKIGKEAFCRFVQA